MKGLLKGRSWLITLLGGSLRFPRNKPFTGSVDCRGEDTEPKPSVSKAVRPGSSCSQIVQLRGLTASRNKKKVPSCNKKVGPCNKMSRLDPLGSKVLDQWIFHSQYTIIHEWRWNQAMYTDGWSSEHPSWVGENHPKYHHLKLGKKDRSTLSPVG